MDVIAVGTGQAIEIGSKGDADVVLVHSRKAEDKFVADGFAKERFDVMYNDFIVVGPKTTRPRSPAWPPAKDAFKAIIDAQAPFASRGDKSGTNTKELSIWSSAAITPTKEMPWYNSLGQGMGDTLLFSNEKGAYTLTDRGTYLSMQDKLPNLTHPGGWEQPGGEQGQGAAQPLRRAGRQPGEVSRSSTLTWLRSSSSGSCRSKRRR